MLEPAGALFTDRMMCVNRRRCWAVVPSGLLNRTPVSGVKWDGVGATDRWPPVPPAGDALSGAAARRAVPRTSATRVTRGRVIERGVVTESLLGCERRERRRGDPGNDSQDR